MKCPNNDYVISKGHRNQLEWVPKGQIRDKMHIKNKNTHEKDINTKLAKKKGIPRSYPVRETPKINLSESALSEVLNSHNA